MNEASAPSTPNLDRLAALKEEYDTQAVGDFLEWLARRGIALCFYTSYTDAYERIGKSTEDLLYEYVGIDKAACDRERQALYEYMRDVQQKGTEAP